MRLMVRTGQHCMTLLEDHVQDVPVKTVQCDELWGLVCKKDARFKEAEKDNPEVGSQYIWSVMDADTKLVISHLVGRRELNMVLGLIVDLKERVNGRPTIIINGLVHYFDAVKWTFGGAVDFARLVKTVRERPRKPVREGYFPARVVTCKPYPLFGSPDPTKISTSYIERLNLTVRMSMRRLGQV